MRLKIDRQIKWVVDLLFFTIELGIVFAVFHVLGLNPFCGCIGFVCGLILKKVLNRKKDEAIF